MILTDRLRFAFEWIPNCDSLLDIGGDCGSVSNEYLKKAKIVSMTDFNEEHLKIGQKRFPKVNFVRSIAEQLPFKSNYFDVATMTDTLEHVRNEHKSLDELHRVLKKDSIAIISVPHRGILGWIDPFNFKFVFPFAYKWLKGKEFAQKQLREESWHRHYSLNKLKKLLGNKFEIEKVHRGGMLFPVLWGFQDLFVVHVLKNKKPDWLENLMSRIYDIDYSVNWYHLGYHIIIKVRKLE